jgi:hypothetical protein
MLILKRASKSRPSGHWSEDDYDVFDDHHIGRIMLHPQAPQGQPWFWTITAREAKPSIHNKSYAPTREQAMADFKARWASNAPKPVNIKVGQSAGHGHDLGPAQSARL